VTRKTCAADVRSLCNETSMSQKYAMLYAFGPGCAYRNSEIGVERDSLLPPPHTHTHKQTHIHTYTHTHIPTYPHTHIHTYPHTHIHTYTHSHIHTYKWPQPSFPPVGIVVVGFHPLFFFFFFFLHCIASELCHFFWVSIFAATHVGRVRTNVSACAHRRRKLVRVCEFSYACALMRLCLCL
jgi:hypothetical protein